MFKHTASSHINPLPRTAKVPNLQSPESIYQSPPKDTADISPKTASQGTFAPHGPGFICQNSKTIHRRAMKSNTLRRVEALAALYNHSSRHTDLAEESPKGQYSKARESQTTPMTPNRLEELADTLCSESVVEYIRKREGIT